MQYYEVEHEIKQRYRALGLTSRGLGNLLDVSPNQVLRKLNGFQRLSGQERMALNEYFTRLESQGTVSGGNKSELELKKLKKKYGNCSG